MKATEHIYDPVDARPTLNGQYRIVCLAPDAEEASRIAHCSVPRATAVTLAEPGNNSNMHIPVEPPPEIS